MRMEEVTNERLSRDLVIMLAYAGCTRENYGHTARYIGSLTLTRGEGGREEERRRRRRRALKSAILDLCLGLGK